MRISDWSSDVCSSDLEDPFELLDALDPNRGRDRPTLGDAGAAGDVVQDAADWGPAAPADHADTGPVKNKGRRDNHQPTRMIPSHPTSSLSTTTSLQHAWSECPIHILCPQTMKPYGHSASSAPL